MKRSRNKHKAEYTRLSRYIDLLIDAICVVDKAGRFEFISASAERIFGYTADEMIGMQMLELVLPEDRERTLAAAQDIMKGHDSVHFENRYVRKDGRIIDILWSARWSEDHQQRIAIARDITRKKNAERRQAALYAISEATHLAEDLPTLYESIHSIVATLLPVASFAIIAYDAEINELSFLYKKDSKGKVDNKVITQTEHADTLLKVSHLDVAQLNDMATLDAVTNKMTPHVSHYYQVFCNQVIRRASPLLLTSDSLAHEPEELHQLYQFNQSSWLGVPLTSQQNIIGVLILHSGADAAPYSLADQELIEFVSTQITTAIERKKMLAKLEHLALYDQLTQLPNRALFHDRIKLALAHAKRESRYISLLFLDLDKFKWVNDTCGHNVGDALLQMTAQRILSCVRTTDTVSRFGGDEFVILLEDINSKENTLKIAQAILHVLNEPFQLAEQSLRILPSIGIALYPEHGANATELLANSDAAMYQAKKKGGNRIEMSSLELRQ